MGSVTGQAADIPRASLPKTKRKTETVLLTDLIKPLKMVPIQKKKKKSLEKPKIQKHLVCSFLSLFPIPL